MENLTFSKMEKFTLTELTERRNDLRKMIVQEIQKRNVVKGEILYLQSLLDQFRKE